MSKLEEAQWDKWHVALADDGCVRFDDPKSAACIAEKECLSKVPIPRSQIYAMGDIEPNAGVGRVSQLVHNRTDRYKVVDEAWAVYDVDGSGSLGLEQVVPLMRDKCRDLGINMPEEDRIVKLFNLVVKDGSGMLGKGEFRTMFLTLLKAIRHEFFIESCEHAAKDYDAHLKDIPETVLPSQSGVPSFDLVLLDVGSDGHVCALFPGHELLNDSSQSWVLPVIDSPEPTPERITFSLRVVNAAAKLVCLCMGDAKKEIALDSWQPSCKLPCRLAVGSGSQKPAWILDKAAGALLPREKNQECTARDSK